MKFPIDFVIITALKEERDAIRKRLPNLRRVPPTPDDIRVYDITRLPVSFLDDSHDAYNIVVLSLLGMGRVEAAMATNDAIKRWKPRYVLLTGIAGGMESKDVKLGDVLIANQIADFEKQKIYEAEESEIRWEAYPVDPRLLGAAQRFDLHDCAAPLQSSRPTPGTPRCHFGTIATGDKVIANEKFLQKLAVTWSSLIGVEMEAGGVAHAAFHAPERPGFFMVRAASDLADRSKGTPGAEQWKEYACNLAASYTIAFLKHAPIPPYRPADDTREPHISPGQTLLGSLPPLPSHTIVGRDKDISLICSRILNGVFDNPCLPSTFTILRGLPGVGKTTLTIQIAHDRKILDAFQNHIAWISVGQTPAVTSLMRSLIFDLIKGSELRTPSSDSEYVETLTRLFAKRHMLLILDDVWKKVHVIPFLKASLGSKCSMLVTTRETKLAEELSITGEDIYGLDRLCDDDAVTLLGSISSTVCQLFPSECLRFAKDVEGLPLAIHIGGRMLRVAEARGMPIRRLLNELHDLKTLLPEAVPLCSAGLTNTVASTLAALLQKSTDLLDAGDRIRFCQLGVFAPKPATFSLSSMKAAWNEPILDDVIPLANCLIDHGLLEPWREGRYWLHSILAAHACYLARTR